MTDLDRQRIAACIGDAFGVLCARVGGSSTAETNLRLGFESILRQLGTPPLRFVSKGAPLRYRRGAATAGELKHILKALDASLAIFDRYASSMSPAEQRVQTLIVATRQFADDALGERKRAPDMALA